MFNRKLIVLSLILLLVSGGLLILTGQAEAWWIFGNDNSQTVTKISFWHAMGGHNKQVINTLVERFNQNHSDIQVTAKYKGSYRETLNSTIASAKQGKPPSVIQSFEIGTRQNIDSGIFVPFEDLVDRGEINWDDYLDPVLNYYRVNGKLYSMPFNSSNAILYYNKNIFAKAGLDPQNPPTTFTGIVESSQKIVNRKVAKAGITWPLHSWFYEQWLANVGQNLVNQENGRAGLATKGYLTSTESQKIISWWKELYNKELWINPGIEAWGQARQNFISQRSAMLITSTAGLTGLTQAAKEQGFEIGTARIPIPTGQERNGVVIGGASLWIVDNKSNKKEEGAKEFVKWMSSTQNQVYWHKETGYFPIRKSAVEQLKAEDWFAQHPNYKTAFNQLLETKSIRPTQGALIGRFMEVRTIVEKSIERILNDEVSVKRALHDANQKVNKSLQKYNQVIE